MTSIRHYRFPIGTVGIAENGEAITHVIFGENEITSDYSHAETPLLKTAAAQLDEYFAGKRKRFDLPLAPKGTPFQLAVWKALENIPYGETRSYKQIAEAVGKPRACRAVGMANNRNPISIILPCHRVVGVNGGLVGYGGGLEAKAFLLELEKQSHT